MHRPFPPTTLLGLLGSAFRRPGLSKVRQQEGSQRLFVNDLSPHRGRIVHPDDHSHLDEVIKRDQGHQKSKQTFKNGEEGKDHPVGEPLRVVLASRVHRLERHVSGVQESEKVHQKLQSTNERRDHSHQNACRDEKEYFRKASLGLKLLEIFCKPKIQQTQRLDSFHLRSPLSTVVPNSNRNTALLSIHGRVVTQVTVL